MTLSATNSDDGPRALRKAKRAARDQLNDAIGKELASIESKLHELMEAAAKRLDVDVSEIRSHFLAYTSGHTNAKPIAWNGLIHEKAKEWQDEKVIYKGGAYMHYVIERIREEGLYKPNEMSEETKNHYIQVAQEARDSKINAGAAKTPSQRLMQGSVKTELVKIGERLDHLHNLTDIECMLLVVRGKSEDGLQPVYFATKKARAFAESQLRIPMNHFITLMESAAIGGAAAATRLNQTETGLAKSELRKALLDSLRDAATSTADDGSPPVITDPSLIRMVEYKNYRNIVENYKVIVYGWPMDDKGSMIDPSSMGLAKFRQYIKLIQDKHCGFKRLTAAEWDGWKEKLDMEIATGQAVVAQRKTRSDAGKKRKNTSAAMVLSTRPTQKRKTEMQASKAQGGAALVDLGVSEPQVLGEETSTLLSGAENDSFGNLPAPVGQLGPILTSLNQDSRAGPFTTQQATTPTIFGPAPANLRLNTTSSVTLCGAHVSTQSPNIPPSASNEPSKPLNFPITSSPNYGNTDTSFRFITHTPETYVVSTGSPRRSRSRTPGPMGALPSRPSSSHRNRPPT